jgi:hypothetical protein
MHALYALLFNFNFAKLYFALFLCFISFSACLVTFSRASFSRAAVRLATFLILFFFTSRAFSSRVIAYYSFFIYRLTLSLTFYLFQRTAYNPLT